MVRAIARNCRILSQHAPRRKRWEQVPPSCQILPRATIDKKVWKPYQNTMKNDCHKKTAVELRIQKSMIKTLGHAPAHATRSAPVSISLLGIVTRFYELERQCSKFGTDVDIHLAEIHTIMAIHNNEGIHVGGLAELLGVTKGSVSELLRRLERKGLAYKAKDPLKMTRLNVFLTEKGKIASSHHLGFHAQLDELVDKAMGSRSTEEVKSIVSFLNEILTRLTEADVKDDLPQQQKSEAEA